MSPNNIEINEYKIRGQRIGVNFKPVSIGAFLQIFSHTVLSFIFEVKSPVLFLKSGLE